MQDMQTQQFNARSRAYTVVGTLAGEAAVACEQLPDAAMEQRTVNVLTDIFGSAVPQPTEALLSRWQHFVHIFGTHSYISTEV